MIGSPRNSDIQISDNSTSKYIKEKQGSIGLHTFPYSFHLPKEINPTPPFQLINTRVILRSFGGMAKLAPNTIYLWIIIREVWGGKFWPMYQCPASTLFNKYVPTVAVLVVSCSRWQKIYNFNPPVMLVTPWWYHSAIILFVRGCNNKVAKIQTSKSNQDD